MNYKFLIAASLFALLLAGCYYDVEEELYPSIECDTEQMSYTNDILPIIQDNCYQCHSQNNNLGAGIVLEGYTNLVVYAESGQLLGVVKHQSGFSPMPKNAPQLPNCNIEKIEAWIMDGAENN